MELTRSVVNRAVLYPWVLLCCTILVKKLLQVVQTCRGSWWMGFCQRPVSSQPAASSHALVASLKLPISEPLLQARRKPNRTSSTFLIIAGILYS